MQPSELNIYEYNCEFIFQINTILPSNTKRVIFEYFEKNNIGKILFVNNNDKIIENASIILNLKEIKKIEEVYLKKAKKIN